MCASASVEHQHLDFPGRIFGEQDSKCVGRCLEHGFTGYGILARWRRHMNQAMVDGRCCAGAASEHDWVCIWMTECVQRGGGSAQSMDART